MIVYHGSTEIIKEHIFEELVALCLKVQLLYCFFHRKMK